jgi:type I restriction enzyme S subunit
MKQHQMVPLGTVAEFVRGITFKPDDVLDPSTIEASTPNIVDVFRTKNVQETLDLTDVWKLPKQFVRRSDQILKHGDILVSSANSWNLVGKCSWVPDLPRDSTFGGFIAALRVSKRDICPRYVYRWFNSAPIQQKMRGCARQTTNIANLDFSRALNIRLPLPPLDEQRRIVAILDQADALRLQERDALKLLEDLPQAIFDQLFGSPEKPLRPWPLEQLQSVVRQDTIITYGIVQAGEEYPGGVPYIRTGDLVDGRIKINGLRHTDPSIAAKFSRSRVEAGEIVMSIRATVGTTALVPPELDGANLTQGTARIAPGARLEREFLLHYLRSKGAQNWISRQVKGATFREITLGRLRELPVLMPPQTLQREFAAQIRCVERMRSAHEHRLTQIDALFASLQHRAFRGEL